MRDVQRGPCTGCGTFDVFARGRRCRDCECRSSKERYQRNRDRYRSRADAYVAAHHVEVLAQAQEGRERRRAAALAVRGGTCTCCGESDPVFLTDSETMLCRNCRGINRDGCPHRGPVQWGEGKNGYWRRLRSEAVSAYGGECACCGETQLEFLQIDHIDGNGAAHRQDLGYSEIYSWLRARAWPPGFQVLCANCNWAKQLGVCPHGGGSD